MYGIFETGYTSLVEIKDKQTAIDLCLALNTKVIKRRIKGSLSIKSINTNKYYVREITKGVKE